MVNDRGSSTSIASLHVGRKMESGSIFLDQVAQTVVGEVARFGFPEPSLGDQKTKGTLCRRYQQQKKT
jgi:hypothetical protein